MGSKVLIFRFLIALFLHKCPLIFVGGNHCESGELYVSCLWNGCKSSRPSTVPLVLQSQTHDVFVMLYNKTKQIEKTRVSNGQYSANFTIPFVHGDLGTSSQLNFTCIWGNDVSNFEMCRRTVVRETNFLPLYSSVFGHNLSFTLSDSSHNDSFRLKSKAIEVKYKINETDVKGNEFLAQVDKYRFDVKNCRGTELGVKEASDTASCKLFGEFVSCPGLLQSSILLTSNIYTAYALIKNSYGICRVAKLCRRVKYYEIFGNIKDVNLLNIRPIGLNISWSYPSHLMNFISSSVTYTVEICAGGNCFYVNVKRERTSEKRTFIVITDDIRYDMNYSIRLQYTVFQSWQMDTSPWTDKVSTVTLSRIPNSSPQIYECQKINLEINLSWQRVNSSLITYYLLQIEQPGEKDDFVRFPVQKCQRSLCKLFYDIGNGEKSHQFRIFSCSKEGCNKFSDSYCLLHGPWQRSKGKSNEEDSLDVVWIVIISLCVSGFVCTVLFYVVLKACRMRSSSDVVIIYPRKQPEEKLALPSIEPLYDTI